MLTPLDIAVIVGWIALTFAAGLWFGRKASASTDDFFVTDRSLPWWAVGTSMVATTFAADTPLAVSGYVAGAGIAANWNWWFTGVGAVVTVFVFARFWRRSGVVTDAELVELRYGGAAGRGLRGLKAIWFGVFLNVLVIAWVMRAMRKITETVLALDPAVTWLGAPTSVWVVLALFVLAVIYTGTSGLWGVIATDLAQFALAMFGAILLAILAWTHVGGLAGMQHGFAAHGFDWERTTALFTVDDPAPDGETAKLLVLLGVVWWAARNVDGGGYLAQRLFSARDENHALWGYLWFTFANLVVRPWPWIIVGLAGMATLGPLEDPELYYPKMMVELLPSGLFGLMVASFLAAFMSTIDTQLHWGASLLINDLYRRFIRPDAPDEHHLRASRVAVVLLATVGALASFVVTDIRMAWELAISVTAGLGAVFVARWLWWRVSAISEITAMVVAMACTFALRVLKDHHPDKVADPELAWQALGAIPTGWLAFPFEPALIVAISLPTWLLVTLLTPAPDTETLLRFYERVRPGGPGWRTVAGHLDGFEDDGIGKLELLGIASGLALVYGALLFLGALLVGQFALAAGTGVLASMGLVGTIWVVPQLTRQWQSP